MAEKWYHLTLEQTEGILNTDLNTGLTNKEAKSRIQKQGKNLVYRIPVLSVSRLVADVVRDPSAFMLLFACILGQLFEQAVPALSIVILVILNWVAVLTVYIRSRLRIAEASVHAVPGATVIREGRKYLVRSTRICRGDIIELKKGDVVPCDARIIYAHNFKVSEASLTGEQEYKRKTPDTIYGNNLTPEFQTDMVFATTVVVSGVARAIVCETGENTLARVLSQNIELVEHDKLNILNSLKKYCSVWSIIMLCLIFAITVADIALGFRSRGFFDAFMIGLSLSCAAMCEYYTVFGYITIGNGMHRILKKGSSTKRGAVIKRSETIEKLKELTTVVVPLKGAFLSGSVKIEKLYCDSTIISTSEKRLLNLCGRLPNLALDCTLFARDNFAAAFNELKAVNASDEERAVIKLCRSLGVFGVEYAAVRQQLEYIPATAEGELNYALMSHQGKRESVIRGDVDAVLGCCSDYRTSEKVKSIKNEKQRILAAVKRMKKQGLGVVCIASKPTEATTLKEIEDKGYIFEGFLAINQPSLPGAMESIEKLRRAGVKVLMINEEISSVGRSYAKALGVISDEDEIMGGMQLAAYPQDLFGLDVSLYRYYEGVGARQKQAIINYLTQNGEKVGFFGNDFEDIGAIEAAHVGFSSGITLNRGRDDASITVDEGAISLSDSDNAKGCEAMKLICDVVVSPADRTEGGFNAIAASIIYSKTVYKNLTRIVRYLITSQTARLCMVLLSLFAFGENTVFFGENIFTPIQLLFLGLICDFIVVLIIASQGSSGNRFAGESNSSRSLIRGNVTSVYIGVFWALLAIAIPALIKIAGLPIGSRELSSVIFFAYLLTQILVAYSSMGDGSVFTQGFVANRVFYISLGGGVLFLCLCAFVPRFATVFNTCTLSILHWATVLVIPLCVFAALELVKLVKNKSVKTKKKNTIFEVEENDEDSEDN